MRLSAVWIFALVLASTAAAQMTPGVIVSNGDPFPAIADFNGDGLDDLIQEKNILINHGSSFVEERNLGLPEPEKVIGVLDVNADGRVDLLVEGTGTRHRPPGLPQNPGTDPWYRLYIADAAHNYGAPVEISIGARPYVADADGDGKDDFLVMSPVRNGTLREVATEVQVLRSQGDGTFERLTPFRIAADVQIVPDHRLQGADFNHDGHPDFVIRSLEDLVILRGTGGGKFAPQHRYLPMRMGWWGTRVADVDGDSNPDILLTAWRTIRVLYGDGRGQFRRMTTTTIEKQHDVNLPAHLPQFNVDQMNQPRNLAIGHFTRSDRTEIAAGMGEGDIVVFGWEQGALREVSRTQTDFWMLDIRPGSLGSTGRTDLYVMGTLIWGEMYPRPRVFYGVEDTTAAAPSLGTISRRRAVSRRTEVDALQMQIRGECISESSQRWAFARDGVFGSSQQGDTTMETVFDGTTIHYRLTAPFAKQAVLGSLAEANGTFSGTAEVLTDCGWKTMSISARRD